MASVAQPWDELPNPAGFLPLSEQIKTIHMVPKIYSWRPSAPTAKVKPRTSLFARDHFGVAIRRGDIVLGTSSSPEVLRIEEIVLDDSKGNPHTDVGHSRFVMDRATGQIFSYSSNWQAKDSIQPLDMSWWGTGIGLVGSDDMSFVRGQLSPTDYMEVAFQHFKARCRPVYGEDLKLRSVSQHLITSLLSPNEMDLLEHYIASKRVPYTGDPIAL